MRWVLAELWGDRARMGLVALGVLWGTLGMATLLAFGSEMVRATTQTTANFGVDLLRVFGGTTSLPFQGLSAGRRIRLELEDVERVANCDGVRGAAWEEHRSSVITRRGDRRHSGGVVGTQAGFADLRPRVPMNSESRFLSERDELEERLVCYLGHEAARALFGDDPAVGETVEILGTPLIVVGVGAKRIQISSYNGRDDEKIYLPIATFRRVCGRGSRSIVVGLESGDGADRGVAAVRATLGDEHGFDVKDEMAVTVFSYQELQNRIGSILGGNRALTAVVAVLGFLVSLLGVANATWARVEERRREIGLAMALGARRFDVMLPPLMEAAITSLVGGLLGLSAAGLVLSVAAGLDLPAELRAYLGAPIVSLSLGAAIVLGLTLSGVLTGWWPARRAASVQPIEVLRDE
ncbi:MAG: ABC transporter permease [Planctomycetota bacterium]